MKKKNQKGFVQIILILVIVFVAIGGAYYFGTLKYKTSLSQTTPTPVVTVQPDLYPTVNWKTYVNSDFELSFLYPSGVKAPEIRKSLPNDLNKYTLIDVNTNCMEMLISKVLSDRLLEDYIRYDFVNMTKDSEWNGYKTRYLASSDNKIQIGGRETINVGPMGESEVDNFFMKDGKNIYHIQTMQTGYGEKSCLTEYNQILSTFKFTK